MMMMMMMMMSLGCPWNNVLLFIQFREKHKVFWKTWNVGAFRGWEDKLYVPERLGNLKPHFDAPKVMVM